MGHKYKAVEVGIFSVVTLIFLNSVYNLFREAAPPAAVARRPMVAGSDSRIPASEQPVHARAPTPGFVPYETRCQPSGELFETSAAKLRITGPFCGAGTGLLESKIENPTARYTATVFNDFDARKFSTDFIPLEAGTNKVVMQFRYKGGKVFPVELTVIRTKSSRRD